MSKEPDSKKISAMPGLAAVGLFVTGVAGVIHAFQHDSGVGLIASALSFGVLLVIAFI